MNPAGLLHSEICGSTVICTLPQLIAACRVLHRLISPRHPPYALTILTYVRHTLTFLAFSFEIFLRYVRKLFLVKCFSFVCFLLYSFQRTGFLIFIRNGGDEENRTPDPLLARQVLSQLSYTPIIGLHLFIRYRCFIFLIKMSFMQLLSFSLSV